MTSALTLEQSVPRERRLFSREELRRAIELAAHLLPAQGPITVFIHHNTLHALEDLPFEEAVVEGSQLFGCKPFLDEQAYRQMLDRERISIGDLQSVLQADLGERAAEPILSLCSRYELRLAMLQHPLQIGTTAELRWLMAETEALRAFRPDAPPAHRERLVAASRHWMLRDLRENDDRGRDSAPLSERAGELQDVIADIVERFAQSNLERWSHADWQEFTLHLLWRICRHGARQADPRHERRTRPIRPRDALLAATGEDTDRLVHDLLIRFISSFLDQGFAPWPLPRREAGFFRCFIELFRQPGGPPDAWLRGLRSELARIDAEPLDPLESITESLDLLGVDDAESFITRTFLALRGWGGMIWQMEKRADRAVHPAPVGSLTEFLAVRLILERLAVAHVARTVLGHQGPLHEVREAAHRAIPPRPSVHVEQRAFLVFQLAQLFGWTPAVLWRLTPDAWNVLLREIESFSGVERRRVFHLAYERRFFSETLDAVSISASQPPAAVRAPAFQALFCIDEREESFRRHLEEIAPECETFGAAGFYSVAMYYRGAGDAHFRALCPVIVRPQHYVREEVAHAFEDMHRRRMRTRQVLGKATYRLHVGSRSFAAGAFLAALLGPVASAPLVARVLFPRLTARLRRMAGQIVRTPPVTQLLLERTAQSPGPQPGGIGYSLDEMAGIVDRQLRDIGLIHRFSRLVLIIGHGSSSMNNPHESAHDCGACGGGRGGPNARAFARMANDPRVRELLKQRGLTIPNSTLFISGYHNTCDESVTYFDLDRLPASHQADFELARVAIDEARRRNAHERCRRFESAPLDLTPEEALRHVEARAEDLAQVRPEFGHATNAVCFVGRRARLAGLYMDRRAFLASYDPIQDDVRGTILARLLDAVIPVCSGISLEYYFSFVDPVGYGCSTKLPHNVTSLLGVMDGAASDLRTGLPWQMVEIHEPMRHLFIIETTPEKLLRIMAGSESIGRLVRNRWVFVAVLAPNSDAIQLYRDGEFVPYVPECREIPSADSSLQWYRGWRDHLGYARIVAAQERARDSSPQKAAR